MAGKTEIGKTQTASTSQPKSNQKPNEARAKDAVADSGKDNRSVRVSQSEFPSMSLDAALRIANGLWNDYAGKNTAPHDVAFAVNMTPTSGPWRNLCGASIAYGLTEGGYNADVMKLTQLGKRIVAPTDEGDDAVARVEAVLKPRIMREFFQKYDRAKFPQDTIAANVLVGMGLPKERAADAVVALKETGKRAGIIREVKTGLFVALTLPSGFTGENTDHATGDSVSSAIPPDQGITPSGTPPLDSLGYVAPQDNRKKDTKPEVNNRVFITHGKSKGIVQQIKELLNFGKFEPVISVERESTAVPVPDKVFHDMRSCTAGVIHVNSEGELLDSEGGKHIHLNQNVLIEIGAAIALFEKRVILLVEKGVTLPSNLQGLYRCEYEGDKLDYEATMKLLKTFNEFRS